MTLRNVKWRCATLRDVAWCCMTLPRRCRDVKKIDRGSKKNYVHTYRTVRINPGSCWCPRIDFEYILLHIVSIFGDMVVWVICLPSGPNASPRGICVAGSLGFHYTEELVSLKIDVTRRCELGMWRMNRKERFSWLVTARDTIITHN